MQSGDTSRVDLFFLGESAWGTYPSGGTLKTLRCTSAEIRDETIYQSSEELRADGLVSDHVLTGKHGIVEFGAELTYGTFDDLLAAMMRAAAWSTTVAYTASTIAAVASPDSFVSSVSGGGFPTTIVAGQWIYVSGFTTAANNGWHKVVTASATTITVTSALATEAEGDSVTIKGAMIRNGTTDASFAFERKHDDITEFLSVLGQKPNTLAINLVAEQKITTAWSFMGLAVTPAQATIGTGTPVAKSTTGVLTASNNVGTLLLDGSAFTGSIRDLTINLTNNLRKQPAIGTIAPAGIGRGQHGVSGSISLYFENDTLYDVFVASTSKAISIPISDSAGNRYMITLPNVRLTNPRVGVPGPNQDVIEAFDFVAIRDSSTSTSIQIDRVAA